MDRDRIERRDFPTGRRGYDPKAVDEHLRRVADEFDAHVRAPRPSLADSTSEQVRLILDAAERGASELRARAGDEASDHVARVQAAADGMLSKLDNLEAELNRLLTALRTSGEHLTQGLDRLQAEVSGGDLDAPPAVDAPERKAPPVASSAVDAPSSDSADPDDPADPADPDDPADPADPDDPADPADPADPDDPAEAASPAAANGAPARNGSAAPDDTLFDPGPGLAAPEEDYAASEPPDAGARLIALNMALSGSSREETARYLAEHFGLDDAQALLDDVYTRAGR